MSTLKQKLSAFNELVVFEHTIFSLPFLFIAMMTASHGWFGFPLLILALLCAITARNFAMAFNRLVDIRYDAQNPRTQNRPSVDGRLNHRHIFFFTLLNGVGFIITTYFINSLAFLLALPVLIVLALYSYMKRFSSMAHLVLGIALGLAPLAGAISVLGSVPLWSIFLSLGVGFWVAGFDILYSLQDQEFDKKMGLYSIPSRFGTRKSLYIARLFHSITILSWTLFILYADLGMIALIGVFIASLMLSYEHFLVKDDLSKINKAFFTVNGYLGFIFFGCILCDIIGGSLL